MLARMVKKARHRVLEHRRLFQALYVVLPLRHIVASFSRYAFGVTSVLALRRSRIHNAVVNEFVPPEFRVFSLVQVHVRITSYSLPYCGQFFAFLYPAACASASVLNGTRLRSDTFE